MTTVAVGGIARPPGPPVPVLGAWTDYTPLWTADGGNPSLGNGTLTGRYKKLDAHTYLLRINLVYGSTSTAGSGTWHFSLPPGLTLAAGGTQVLTCHVNDANVSHWAAVAKLDAGATVVTEIHPADGSTPRVLTNNQPMAWQTSDSIDISGVLETA